MSWLFKKQIKEKPLYGKFPHFVTFYPDDEEILIEAMKLTGGGIKDTIVTALKFYVYKHKG